MSRISVVDDEIELNDPTLVEGFPGVGLVGKIAVDHLVRKLDLRQYANVYCDGLPKVAVYEADSTDVSSPVRLYADDDGELVVLQSDVPMGADAAEEFADCLSPWLSESATPLFVAGKATDDLGDGERSIHGVASPDLRDRLAATGIEPPEERGAVSGPTGVLLHRAVVEGRSAIGLIVDCNPRFPDPRAARVLLEEAIRPLAGTTVDADSLLERADQIRSAREEFARRMDEADGESSKATPLRMYQ